MGVVCTDEIIIFNATTNGSRIVGRISVRFAAIAIHLPRARMQGGTALCGISYIIIVALNRYTGFSRSGAG